MKQANGQASAFKAFFDVLVLRIDLNQHCRVLRAHVASQYSKPITWTQFGSRKHVTLASLWPL